MCFQPGGEEEVEIRCGMYVQIMTSRSPIRAPGRHIEAEDRIVALYCLFKVETIELGMNHQNSRPYLVL